jgi:hypothetical protein
MRIYHVHTQVRGVARAPVAVAGVGVPVITHRRSASSSSAIARLLVSAREAPREWPSSMMMRSQCTCWGGQRRNELFFLRPTSPKVCVREGIKEKKS